MDSLWHICMREREKSRGIEREGLVKGLVSMKVANKKQCTESTKNSRM